MAQKATKISVIIATRNRAAGLQPCLDAAARAVLNAPGASGEIIVVDNGSTDDTSACLRAWGAKSSVPLKALHESRPGKSKALNLALKNATGELLIFTDDDCHLHRDHVNDALRHFSADRDIVVRGGRIELGDDSDLPITINTDPEPIRWSLADNSARHDAFCGRIVGANTVAPRALFDRIGPFDEHFGPGAGFGPCDDTDMLYRAYLGGFALEYVPDMKVFHFHGRKQPSEGVSLMRQYQIGNGALFSKYIFKHPNLCRPLWWDIKGACKEIVTGSNLFMPQIGFSHKDKVWWTIRGAVRYAAFA
jgi:glycosyltransferase involved in cell wall biosynthesis